MNPWNPAPDFIRSGVALDVGNGRRISGVKFVGASMLQPKPQQEPQWAQLQQVPEEMRIETPALEPSAAPINPERIHDAAGLKIVIVALVLGAALAIAWIVHNQRPTLRVPETGPSQGVTVTTGPQHTVTKTSPTSKPIQKPAGNRPSNK